MMQSKGNKWKTVRLCDVADIERNGIDPANIKTGTLYVGLEHITGNGQFINVGKVSTGDLASTKFVFSHHHVLYGKLRPYLRKIARPSFEGVCSTDILPILPKRCVDRDYLFHYLRQPRMVDLATTRSAGANLPRISPKVLDEFEVLLPPIDEQRRIAAVLDKAAALREKRRQAINKLDTLLQAIFLNIFGDPVTNPKGWEQHAIGTLPIKVSDGNYSSKYPRAEEFTSEGVPFIRANNLKNMTVVADDMRFITPEKHQELKKGHLQRNDLLITTRGDIGIASLVPSEFEGANINAQIVLLRSTNELINPYFLLWVFNDAKMKRHMESHQTGSALKQLPVGKLIRILLPVPPKELQRKFADICIKAQPVKSRQLESEQKVDFLFSSLQQRAFNGELFNGKATAAVTQKTVTASQPELFD